jgi:prepilin-type N-terminal cleavage/methylation domain-containing protein
MRTGSRRGVTLIEVLIAVSLLALLSVAMLIALRVALSAMAKADTKLMDNRRIAGAQRIIEQEIEGLMPMTALCSGNPDGSRQTAIFFQGEPNAMRFVSTFSLQQGWRGQPQILEFTAIPGADGVGVRLVVNEIPFSPEVSGKLCMGRTLDPLTGRALLRFIPIEHGPASFILADKLAGCRFSYLEPPLPNKIEKKWYPQWSLNRWPLAIRIEMAPLAVDGSKLQPAGVTLPVYVTRSPEMDYGN